MNLREEALAPGLVTPEASRRAASVSMILLDSDGVLTDGTLWIAPGGFDARGFHARDGLGIRLGQRGGITFGIISGRECAAVAERAGELDIDEVHLGTGDKLARMKEVLSRTGHRVEQVCFVGDDLVDLSPMLQVGLAVAPADGVEEARRAAHYVTSRPGGRGVVREVVDFVLRAQDKYQGLIEPFTR